MLLYISHTKLSFVAKVVTHPLTPPLSKAVYPWKTLRHDRHTSVAFVFPPRCALCLLPTRQLSSYSIICGTLSAEMQKATPRLLLNCNRCTATVPPLSGLRNRIEPSSFITAIIYLNHIRILCYACYGIGYTPPDFKHLHECAIAMTFPVGWIAGVSSSHCARFNYHLPLL